MTAAFASALGRAEGVCIIGTDAPSVTASTVEGAFQALEDHDVVIGPAADGGYYLLALKLARPELFSDVNWSTSEVLDTTLTRARKAGLTVHLLDSATDVDTLQDVPAHLLNT